MKAFIKLPQIEQKLLVVKGCIESVCSGISAEIGLESFPREIVLPQKSILTIKGWIINDLEGCIFNSVFFYLNGDLFTVKKQSRQDVASVYGEQYIESGFVLHMTLPDLDIGEYMLKIVGVSTDGKYFAANDSVKLIIVDKSYSSRPPFSDAFDKCKALKIHPQDFLFIHHVRTMGIDDAMNEYINDGYDSAIKLKTICEEIFTNCSRLSLLEFACGYGRVTRHIDKNYFEITSSDIHNDALLFIKDNFNVKTIISTIDPDDFRVDNCFDVVFALSFFSHVPDKTFGKWIQALYRCLNPGGVLIFTTHGNISNENYIHIPVSDNGYAFINTSEQFDLCIDDYGTAISEYSYVSKICEEYISTLPNKWIEGYWWSHQDLYVIRKKQEG